MQEIDRIPGVDVKAVPVDHDLLTGLIDCRGSAAGCDRRGACLDHTAFGARIYAFRAHRRCRRRNSQHTPQRSRGSKRTAVGGGQVGPEFPGR